MPYLSDLIHEHKANENNSNEWKIQISMNVDFVSSNQYYFLWSDNVEIRLGNETDDIIKGLIKFLKIFLK